MTILITCILTYQCEMKQCTQLNGEPGSYWYTMADGQQIMLPFNPTRPQR